QRGCDYRCTFCIVPMTRGPERSRKLADVVREVAGLAARGTTEVTLLGQTVNSYHDGEHDFADLVRAVGVLPGIRRLRFTSPYPTDFSERVLAAMAETRAVCEHVHLPVQSGSNRVLRRMLHRYTGERQVARSQNVAVVGTTHGVLVEGKAKRGGLLQARTRSNKVALLDGPDEWIGTYRRVRLTGTTGSTFTAWPVAQELAVVG